MVTTTNFWGVTSTKEEEVDPSMCRIRNFYKECIFCCFAGDLEISLLKKRLEETEKAMERIVAQVNMLEVVVLNIIPPELAMI